MPKADKRQKPNSLGKRAPKKSSLKRKNKRLIPPIPVPFPHDKGKQVLFENKALTHLHIMLG